MPRFDLKSLVKRNEKRRHSYHTPPLAIVSEGHPRVASESASDPASTTTIPRDPSSIENDQEPSEISSSSYNPSTGSTSFGQSQLQRRHSFESSVDTLFMDDSASTVNTLIPGIDSSSASITASRRQNSTGYCQSLPIYATRFRSGVHVYESDVAATISRTVTRQRKQQKESENDIPLPPALFCCTQSSYNPFSFSSKVPYMKIYRQGKTLRSSTSGQPKTLLANQVHQHNIELGLEPSTGDIAFTEEQGTTPFCVVWQKVVNNDQVKYILEFDNNLDYAQSSIILYNDGRRRVTRGSYDGVRFQWNGTTGLASPFGSGYFQLHFNEENEQEEERDTNLSWLPTIPLLQPQNRRPPVAVYHNVGVKALAVTRKVGEFIIWEPGFKYADIIVAMGLVLREQEQRKEIEGHAMAYNKLANF